MPTLLAGRYELLELVGAGGQGTVHRARDHAGDRLVALKLFSVMSERELARFEREADLLSRAALPGVVRYIDHGRSGERAFLAMEWLEGETLLAHLRRRGALPDGEALALAAALTRALAGLHERGLIHRDLKPANILLEGRDPARPTILDLGTARDERYTGETVGTPGYVAPEQAQGRADVDGRADLFALGCVLYHALAGRPPFVGKNELAVMAKIVLGPSPPLPGRAPALAALVARLLGKDPAARPRDARELLELLAAAGRGDELPPAPPARLGATEHQILSVVMAARPGPAAAAEPVTHALTRELESHESEPSADLQVRQLGAAAVVVTVASGTSVAAQAARAARYALALHQAEPGTAVAVATGPGLLAFQLPVGDVLDDCAGLVRAEADRAAAEYERPRLLCDRTTADLLGADFVLRRDGERIVLGGERPAPAPRPGPPLVGRDAELARMVAAFTARRAALVLCTGPAGSGKSRLGRELVAAARARAPALRVRVARGDPLRAGSPHAMLRSAFPAEPLEEWLGDAGGLLVLEDLHWGDLPSLREVGAALRRRPERPFLAVALARPEARARFAGELAELAPEELALAELDGPARRELAGLLLGAPPDAPAVQRLVERAGGLPLFLEEMARFAGGEPPTLAALVAARMKTLGAGARALLRAGSVYGERFTAAGALALLGAGFALEPALRELVRADIVHEAEGGLAFRHVLLRDAAYSLLTDDDRRTGHRLAAAFLAAAGEDDPETLAAHQAAAGDQAAAAAGYEQAAARALAAGDFEAAVRLADAGLATGERRAALLVAAAEASNWLGESGRARRLAEEAAPLVARGTALRGRLVAELAIALGTLGDTEALLALERSLVPDLLSCRGWDDPDAAAHLRAGAFLVSFLALGGVRARADPRLLRLVQEIAPGGLPPRVWADVLVARATVALIDGRGEEAMEQLIAAADDYDRAGAPASARAQRGNAGYVAIEIGAFSEAEALLMTCVYEDDGRTERGHTFADQLNLGRAVLCNGHPDEAIRLLESGLARAARARQERYVGTAELYLADAHRRRGERDEALRLAARAAARVAPWPPIHAPALAVLGQLLLEAGAAGEALEHGLRAVAILEAQGGAEERESLVRLVHARALEAAGRRDEARAALRAARDRLLQRAAALSPGRRRAMLEAVAENAETLELAARWGV